MRTSWALCAAATIAGVGCNDGIYIEVRAPEGIQVDEVQLVIGNRPCKVDDIECAGIQPLGFEQHLGGTGDVFFQDNENDLAIEPVVDGSAWFELQPGDGVAQILALGNTVADGRTVAASVMVPINLSNSRVHYLVELERAEPLSSEMSTGAGAGVTVWSNDAGRHCYGVQDYSSERGPVFIVPESDPDCDSVTVGLECDPLGYQQTSGGADPSNPTCLSTFLVDTTPACMIGAGTCDELTGQGGGCGPTNWCLPDAVCGSCKSLDVFDPVCVASALVADTTTKISCTIRVEQDLNGDFIPCAIAPPMVQFDTVIGASCAGLPLIAQFDGTSVPNFQGELQADTGNSHVLKLKPITFVDPCTFDLQPDGFVDPAIVDNTVEAPLPALFKIETNGFVSRTLLMPLAVTFASGCLEPNTCEIDQVPDGIYACGAGQ